MPGGVPGGGCGAQAGACACCTGALMRCKAGRLPQVVLLQSELQASGSAAQAG